MSARKIYRPVREVEHLFDAHYRASRPRRRIIRVCGGVRGRGRWVTSPGAFTLLFFALLLPRLLAPSYLSVRLYLSLSVLLSVPPRRDRAVSLSLIRNRVLFSQRRCLPTTCEGDGAAAWLYESRPHAGTLHSMCIAIILIAYPAAFRFQIKGSSAYARRVRRCLESFYVWYLVQVLKYKRNMQFSLNKR